MALEHETGERTGLLQEVFAHSPASIHMKDLEQRWLFANPACHEHLGWPLDMEPRGMRLEDTLSEEMAVSFAENDRIVIAAGRPMVFTEQVSNPETGEVREFLSVKFPVTGDMGETQGVGGISFEITEQATARRERDSAMRMMSAVFSAARLGIVVMKVRPDGSAEVIECNDAFIQITGFSRDEMVGRTGSTLIHPDDQALRMEMIMEMRQGRKPVTEVRFMRAEGDSVWCLAAPSMTVGPNGEQLVMMEILDITERREIERQLRHNAEHDSLTDLLSRRRFLEVLEDEITHVRESGRPASVLLLDLDGFKYVNDIHGHSIGDRLLRRISGVLESHLRGCDQLARIGGDEFAVLLPDTTIDDALTVGRKLVDAVEEHGRMSSEGGRVEVTASIGATSWYRDTPIDADQVLAEADIAMYDAKEAGKNRTALYERGGQRRRSLASRSDRLVGLRDAIARGRFVLHAQPIVPLLGPLPEVPHYELLVRMRHDDQVLVMPGDFLPDAQRHGLITDIDAWVLAEAVRTVKLRRLAGRPITVSVNLSADSIEDPELGERIATLLRINGVPPSMLTVELTETGAITDLGRARELSLQLREVGCKLALDDFGAAFATLQYLKHIHFDQVKIDGDFIRALPRSPADQLIVKAVADIASGFGAEVVAEFIENAETVEILKGFGVQYGQGYYLGRPEPLS